MFEFEVLKININTMNDIFSYKSINFQNPEYKPLEDLKLIVQNSGVSTIVPALDKLWSERKCFLNYESPNLFDSNGRDIIGAKKHWLELGSFILNDISWLLHMPFYKFWSNIIYNPTIMDSITIFLQEAPTFYLLDSFPKDYDINELFNCIRQNILLIFARLATNKESPSEYISLSEHAYLLYSKYIFTIPILMDLCQQYGRDNRKIVEKIVNTAFMVQPLYTADLEKAVTFIKQALRNIERRFEDCPVNEDGKAVLLSERGGANVEITLSSFEVVVLYLLDTVSTISIFVDICPSCINSFKTEDFIKKLVSVYGNTIPEMYKRLNGLAFNNGTTAKYVELKHRLDISRLEILNTYRTIIYKNIEDIIQSRNFSISQITDIVEDFFIGIMHILSEREFVIDYHNLYPIINDLQILIDLYPDLDTVKSEFIINSIFTFLDEPVPSLAWKSLKKKIPESVAGSGNSQNNKTFDKNHEIGTESSKINLKLEFDKASLVSGVKDVLCDLGEGFIEKCLRYYNDNKEAVINAVLEDSLPAELTVLDRSLPFIPPDAEETLAAVDNTVGIQRLNIYDNDEFDIMSKDVMDTSRIYRGKRKDKYKDLNDLLNDKAHVAEKKDFYNKYSIVNEYDDEYDDTYDDQNITSNAQDDIAEVDSKPFTVPRILRKQEINENGETEEDNDLDYLSESQKTKDNFVQNPAVLRAEIEKRKLNKQRISSSYSQRKTVIGNSKCNGQIKEIIDNRNKKNKYKVSRANHNRRSGSQWKRDQGMVPS